mgnify:CR=1 FL=1
MQVGLVQESVEDAQDMWALQKAGFAELLRKYQDVELNPACEPLERVQGRLMRTKGAAYFITAEGERVGAIFVRWQDDGWKKLGPLWVLPAWQGRGIAQQAIRLVEEIHGSRCWVLDTILQEQGNCHLYEKLGYRRTGGTRVVNERMTLVDYVKD